MKLEGEQVLLRMHMSNFVRWHTGPLYEALVGRARREHLAGATVLSGIYGYVDRGRVLGEHPNALQVERPVVVEIVDTRERIEAFMPLVDEAIGEGLATLEPVQIRFYRSGVKP